MLEMDFRFLTSKIIGKNGLTPKQQAEIRQKAQNAFEEVKKEKEQGKLGFARVIHNSSLAKSCLDLKRFSGKVKNLVILGIGGSALGARALVRALKPEAFLPGSFQPKLFVLDNIDPDWLNKIFKRVFSEPSLFFAVSKSGTTAETSAQLLYLVKKLKARYKKEWKKWLIIITDPERGAFREFARRQGLMSLEIPREVGGRFSVLTPVGLAPAALLEIDIKKLLKGAQTTEQIIFSQNPLPAYFLGGIFWEYTRRGFKNLVLMPYSSLQSDFSEWFAQLWAESLGKRYSLSKREVRAGSTPIRALGATDQHSQLQLYLEGPQDKLIVFLRIENFSRQIKIPKPEAGLEALKWLSEHSFSELINTEQIATSSSLAKNQVPNLTITIPKLDAYHLGGLFYFFELLTVIAGRLFQVNPFDQPGVEQGKKYTKALMGDKEFIRERKELKKFLSPKTAGIYRL